MFDIVLNKGLIKKKKIPITQFFNNIFDFSRYKRHAIYKWRRDKYFPASVIYDLYKSKYNNEIAIFRCRRTGTGIIYLPEAD